MTTQTPSKRTLCQAQDTFTHIYAEIVSRHGREELQKHPIVMTTMNPFPAICHFTATEATLDSPILGQWRIDLLNGELVHCSCTLINGTTCDQYPDLQYNKNLPQVKFEGSVRTSHNDIHWYSRDMGRGNCINYLVILGGPAMCDWKILQHSWVLPSAALLGSSKLTRSQRETMTEQQLLNECRKNANALAILKDQQIAG
jgi:hypothetical protein